MKTKKLRIGIVDAQFYSLQDKLLSEGHSLFIYIEGESQIPPEYFNVTPQTKGSITQVLSLHELIQAKCDVILTDPTRGDHFSKLQPFHKNILGYSQQVYQLETDRYLCKELCKTYGIDKHIKIPTYKQFTSLDGLTKFLSKSKSKWVIKESERTFYKDTEGRTRVIQNNKDFIRNFTGEPWFDQNGVGGCILEEFAEGLEVSFGSWYRQGEFQTPLYYYMEHKGACNGDRGGILTGEVGTTMTHRDYDTCGVKLIGLFKSIATMLKAIDVGNKTSGMIDVNCIINKQTGELTLLEFTCRFGRPTLEMQLALIRDNKNLGCALNVIPDNLFYCWGEDTHSVGVTVFTYGLPMISNIKYLTQNQSTIDDINKASMLPSTRSYKLPRTKPGSKCVQLFDHYNADTGLFEAKMETRHFISCGIHTTVEGAISNAYAPLENFACPGMTWRDDIGHNLQELIELLTKHGWLKWQ